MSGALPRAALLGLIPRDMLDGEPLHRPRCSCGGETITFPCDCTSPSCGVCDGTRTGHAVVTRYSVTVGMPGRGGVTFDRGAESEARIATALEMVDAECREHLERLLRTDEDDEPELHHVAVARSVSFESMALRPMPALAPMDLMATLIGMVRVAVQDAPIPFTDKVRAMAQLGGAR